MAADTSWTLRADVARRNTVPLELATTADVPPPSAVSLSIIVPAFDEQRTIARAVSRLLAIDLPCDFEVIVVDDGSTDLTPAVMGYLTHPYLTSLRHETNQGKGAAVLTGLARARGTHVLIFDADLEYAPEDISLMIEPIVSGDAAVVFGRRPLRVPGGHRGVRFLLGNLVTTRLARLLYRAPLTDLHTCFKLVPRELLGRMPLHETRFGLDTQIAVGVLRSGEPLVEVPISYRPRSREDGKKIGWRDGLRCVYLLLKYRVVPALRPVEKGEVRERDDRAQLVAPDASVA